MPDASPILRYLGRALPDAPTKLLRCRGCLVRAACAWTARSPPPPNVLNVGGEFGIRVETACGWSARSPPPPSLSELGGGLGFRAEAARAWSARTMLACTGGVAALTRVAGAGEPAVHCAGRCGGLRQRPRVRHSGARAAHGTAWRRARVSDTVRTISTLGLQPGLLGPR